MSILHTVNTSPTQTFALQHCLQLLNEGDCLLLIEDAVVAVQAQHSHFEQLEELNQAGRLMVLESDLRARGICATIGQQCNYLQFVELVAKYQSQMAW